MADAPTYQQLIAMQLEQHHNHEPIPASSAFPVYVHVKNVTGVTGRRGGIEAVRWRRGYV